MDTKTPYMNITTLAASLNEMAQKLEKGRLKPEEITEMLGHAQQLYERMVVLNFQAFAAEGAPFAEAETSEEMARNEVNEPEVHKAPMEEMPVEQNSAEEEVNDSPPDEPEEEPVEENAAERPAFRFGAPQVAPNQISLIDSIEEIKRMESSINDQFKDAGAKTLSHKLKKSPISDLKTAIGINLRFQFTTALFSSDAEAYNAAIEKLNKFTSYLEADEYVENTLKNRYDWEMKNPTVKQFIELVERRYL